MQKIAIAGYGVEGKSSLEYWQNLGADITVFNESPIDEILPDTINIQVGKDIFSHMNGFDVVVRSPSIAPSRIQTDGKIWSTTNEFFAQCPAPIIGVTASKGKGTICSFIASILRSAGKKVHLVGNIGVPSLAILPNITAGDVVVFELSSFQLWDLERSPTIGIVGHIEPDHLDVHQDFEEYVQAKSHISKYMTSENYCFFYPKNTLSKEIASSGGAKIAPYISETGIHFDEHFFYKNQEKICALSSVKIPGIHNAENACAALSVCLAFADISYESIREGLEGFGGLPHRLKFVDSVSGVDFFDDSIATTPGSAIAALRSFSGRPVTLILGGSSKGADFSGLVQEMLLTKVPENIVLIGEEGERLAQIFAEKNIKHHVFSQKNPEIFDDILPEICVDTKPGDVVILSPACASFDMFASYSDRGERFISAVKNLKSSARG